MDQQSVPVGLRSLAVGIVQVAEAHFRDAESADVAIEVAFVSVAGLMFAAGAQLREAHPDALARWIEFEALFEDGPLPKVVDILTIAFDLDTRALLEA